MYDSNYENDSRVRAATKGEWWDSVDVGRMVAYIEHDNGGEEYEQVAVKLCYEVCSTCGGRGTHVNPSIDCDGLSAEDFGEDPDFREDYFSGAYDVPCYECHGRNVSLCMDRQSNSAEVIKVVEDRWDCERQSQAEYAAERRMGA